MEGVGAVRDGFVTINETDFKKMVNLGHLSISEIKDLVKVGDIIWSYWWFLPSPKAKAFTIIDLDKCGITVCPVNSDKLQKWDYHDLNGRTNNYFYQKKNNGFIKALLKFKELNECE